MGERSSLTEPYILLPAEQELRCGLRPLGVGVFGSRPLAVLGLTAANNAALVAEFVVRFAWLVEREHDS